MLKVFVKLIFISIVCLPLLGQSQEITINRSNNKVSLNGQPFYIHIVRKGETLFAISKEYQVPVDSIKQDNLHLTSELTINQYIKIRISESEQILKEKSYVYHKVVKGDTPYNIARRYDVSINDIYENNINSELGIKMGEILKIPTAAPTIESSIDTLPDESQTGFIVHTVKKKETKYGIAKQYNVGIIEIEEYNPELTERPLKKGELIKIPIKDQATLVNIDVIYHKVNKQETVYGLTQQYQISTKQFYKLNPKLEDRGLQVDELVMIPKTNRTDSISAQGKVLEMNDEIPHQSNLDTYFSIPCPSPGIDTLNIYKVAFFVPMYLNINDTLGKFIEKKFIDEDGVEMTEMAPRTNKVEDKIYGRSNLFLEFYEGALLAINELKKSGMSFEIHIFDTQNDSLYTADLLKNNKLDDFNLFIGPFYSDILNVVSDYAWEHQINIVSPLSLNNQFIEHNPYAFQVSPPFEIQMLHASEYLNEFDTKNYIVIHDGKNINQDYISAFKQELYSNLNDSNLNQVKYNEVFYYDARDSVLKDVFTPGMENIVIVPSSNQAFVSDVMGKINGYSYNYKITMFGQPRWVLFDNIELESFHNTHTHIFSNSFIDYSNPYVISFVQDYRIRFNGEPSKYAFQGFDITKYFLTALNKYGHEFRKCIHMLEPELLQTNFNFVPYADQGGYQNTAIYILEYTKEHRLVKSAEFPQK